MPANPRLAVFYSFKLEQLAPEPAGEVKQAVHQGLVRMHEQEAHCGGLFINMFLLFIN
ncbi:hypothetical protein [Hymenobacter terrigena]